jgi:valyl-tRNA synthetase
MQNNSQTITQNDVSTSMNSLADKYHHGLLETHQQNIWQDSKIMTHGNLDAYLDQKPFCVFLPPPNVTGTLHMGHGFNQTIMDILIRHARMSGHDALWVPGMDHAGIATQIVVERQLQQQGVDKNQLSREEFIQKVWDWKEQSGSQITEQIKRLGGSLHWDQNYFTMDEKMSAAVRKAFVQLYEDGLIYRGQRLVNWDPSLQTAVSDLEVTSQEEQGFLWHISYTVEGSDAHIVVATTRPETLLGDVAVMVNPNDERYQHLIGQFVKVPVANRLIPIIADEYVDLNFGTGAVKVTPAHDFNDYQVAKRHGLTPVVIFDLQANCNHQTPTDYQGLSREAARAKILKDLESINALVAQKPHTLMIPRCERTNTIIEPMLTYQWFLDLTEKNKYNQAGDLIQKGGWSEITKPALDAIEQDEYQQNSEKIRITPHEWVHTYNHWLENIQDWCLSRQLVWGHQIPAWYGEAGEVFVAETLEKAKEKAKVANYNGTLKQDDDVLDTWFSSSLVPFASLGWADDSLDFAQKQKILDHFLPSASLITGYDIIFFWVARMVMMTRYFTGKNPFKDVYVHGLVRDAEGKKMSKSEGNTLDPIDLIDGIDLDALLVKRTQGLRRPETAPKVIEKTKQAFADGIPSFGADALRFTFASLATLGRHINFDAKRCEGYLHFCNKLWNATRFVLMQVKQHTDQHPQLLELLKQAKPLFMQESSNTCDDWFKAQLNEKTAEIAQHIKTYRFDLMANTLYALLWEIYCDWYVEFAKITLQNQQDPNNLTQKQKTLTTLLDGLYHILKLIHPVMPFITEALFKVIQPYLPNESYQSGCLAQQKYPEFNQSYQANISQKMIGVDDLKEWIQTVRQMRAQMNVSPAQKRPMNLYMPQTWQLENTEGFQKNQQTQALLPYLKALAKLEKIDLSFYQQITDIQNGTAVGDLIFELIVIESEAEKEARIGKLKKQQEKLKQELEKCEARLNAPGYSDKAPAHLVEQDRQRIQTLKQQIDVLSQQL